MADDPILVPAALDHLGDDGLGLRRHAQMDLLCPQPQDRPGPVMAPVSVSHHLALIYHHDIKIFMVI